MLDPIRDACDLSIRRACGFAVLAIFTLMVGTSYDPLIAIRTGAIGLTILSGVLAFKGWRAPKRPYKRTETWLILGKRHSLPEARAQAIFGGILRERYHWYATVAAAVALPMWGVATFLDFWG